MQLTAEDEMAEQVRACLQSLDELEAEFIEKCWLCEPRVPLKYFSEKWHLSAKDLNELRSRVLVRLRELLAARGIESVTDIC